MSTKLRAQIVRIAHANPELRPHLLPLVAPRGREAGQRRKAAFGDQIMERIRPQWEDLRGQLHVLERHVQDMSWGPGTERDEARAELAVAEKAFADFRAKVQRRILQDVTVDVRKFFGLIGVVPTEDLSATDSWSVAKWSGVWRGQDVVVRCGFNDYGDPFEAPMSLRNNFVHTSLAAGFLPEKYTEYIGADSAYADLVAAAGVQQSAEDTAVELDRFNRRLTPRLCLALLRVALGRPTLMPGQFDDLKLQYQPWRRGGGVKALMLKLPSAGGPPIEVTQDLFEQFGAVEGTPFPLTLGSLVNFLAENGAQERRFGVMPKVWAR